MKNSGEGYTIRWFFKKVNELLGNLDNFSFCRNSFPSWLPLAVTCIIIAIFHVISIVLIEVILCKTLDPTKILKMSETIGESEMEEPGQISRILNFSIPSTGNCVNNS